MPRQKPQWVIEWLFSGHISQGRISEALWASSPNYVYPTLLAAIVDLKYHVMYSRMLGKNYAYRFTLCVYSSYFGATNKRKSVPAENFAALKETGILRVDGKVIGTVKNQPGV